MGHTEPFSVLAEHCSVGALVCKAVADGRILGTVEVRRLCTIAGIAQARGAEVEAFLEAAQTLGYVGKKTLLTWDISNKQAVAELAPQLRAIHIYRSGIHQEKIALKSSYPAPRAEPTC